MERRPFPAIGIGLGCMEESTDAEIERAVARAIEGGISWFDACAASFRVFAPFGRAIKGARDEMTIQMHFGASYGERGEYTTTRSVREMREMFDRELSEIGTDHADFGMLHCVDTDEHLDELGANGALELMREMKRSGAIRRVGVSSHTPSVASRAVRELDADLLMFSINPAYDLERRPDDDELGRGTSGERAELLETCAANGVGIAVMKPFCGGTLLRRETSPFGIALTTTQCISYALDRPGVIVVIAGARNDAEVEALLAYERSLPIERDWSSIANFVPSGASARCVYCNHCQPCPAGIDIALVNRWYDLALAGDRIAAGHYADLGRKAGSCVRCRRCSDRCPFKVDQADRMREILGWFGE